ncbi:hypothetical protein LCGC14_2177170 [marine sediment metagenome]|uniref:Uncharacterized protein n=1 Tax=marine sediment metagenome TaxID=412755 RepID=A0A0F9G0W1_9ZZZZ
MHLLPEGTTKREAEKLRKFRYCSECGGTAFLFAELGSDRLKIGCRHHPDATIVKDYTPRDPMLERVGVYDRGDRERMTETIGQEKATALMAQGIPLNGVITKVQLMEVFHTVWPGADDLAVFKGVAICEAFGLHPLMKHLFLIPFNTKVSKRGEPDRWEDVYEPVLGIAATRLIAGKHGEWSFDDMSPRVMTEEEQLKVWGKTYPDDICAITILLNKWGGKTYGYGRWPKEVRGRDGKVRVNEPKGTDKGNSMENMAMIRSERNALGKLAPEPDVLNGVRTMDERYMSIERADGQVEAAFTAEGERVDPATGEILGDPADITDVEIPGAEPEPQPEPEPEPPPEPAPKAKAKAKPPEREPAKDETPVTHAQGKEIERLFSHDGAFDPASMGEFCNAQRNWGIRQIVQLKKWQYDIIVDCFSRGS